MTENENIKTENEEIKKENKVLTAVKNYAKKYFIHGFSGMALGLFCTLIIGTILKTVGERIIGTDNFIGANLSVLGSIASLLMGAGIGAGMGYVLKADKFVLFSLIVVGMLGAKAELIYKNNGLITSLPNFTAGDPIGSFVAVIIAYEVGQLVKGRVFGLDIVLVPLAVILTAFFSIYILCPPIIMFTRFLGECINKATDIVPLVMGMVVAVSVGLLLTLPTSSAAICIAIGLTGIAGGAGAVGGACHMIGFAVMSFRENKYSGLFAQGLGTSMLQIPNVFKKPLLLIPPIIASAVCGGLSAALFKLECLPYGAGMGTAGLVGIFGTVEASTAAGVSTPVLVLGIALLFFILPAVICFALSELFRKKNWFSYGDMKLDL